MLNDLIFIFNLLTFGNYACHYKIWLLDWTGQFDQLMTSDLYNLLPNPDTNDEADPDSMFINPYSVYQN